MHTFNTMMVYRPKTTLALIGLAIAMIIVVCLPSAPCEYEDSNHCYWDAKTMGNGEGRSFVNVFGHSFNF